jgi:hypothetical protein
LSGTGVTSLGSTCSRLATEIQLLIEWHWRCVFREYVQLSSC